MISSSMELHGWRDGLFNGQYTLDDSPNPIHRLYPDNADAPARLPVLRAVADTLSDALSNLGRFFNLHDRPV